MSLDPIKLREFLTRVNTPILEPLPLVHSTRAKNIYDIFRSGKVLTMPCNVFKGEKLCYCFVGRPAYKWEVRSPRYWQLPLVLIMRFDQQLPLKRVYPFDTGAFSTKLPDYLTTFSLDAYEMPPSKDAIGRLVSLFFESNSEYYMGKGVSEERFKERHDLTPRHQELEALLSLYNDRSLQDADDRSRAVEVQVASDLIVTKENLIGVVMPSEYRRDSGLVAHLKDFGMHLRYYDHYPVHSLSYTTQIYEEVRRVLKKSKLL